MIDLHFHSSFSDGSLSPTELAINGSKLGLYAMVLTDHDNLSGFEEFQQEASKHNIKTISGIELSVESHGNTVHMLAYGVHTDNQPLNDALVKIRKGRQIRNSEILSKLVKYGCCITINDVMQFAGDKNLIARPHFAQALIKKGYASSKEDAFKRYLGKTGIAYTDRFRLAPEEAISLIHDAGGIAVLAHPYKNDMSDKAALYEYIKHLVSVGLDGLEVFYTQHSYDMISELSSYCREMNLISTGGSDFHGAISPNIELGKGLGGLSVPDYCFDDLLYRIEMYKKKAQSND